MSFEVLLALIVFSFVSSITPGPNNLMLLASGTVFGFRRTIPHMLGISLGFSFMLIVVGLGLAGIFDQFPAAYTVLKVVSVVYMLWLAWKIANASAPGSAGAGRAGAGNEGARSKPLSFLQAAAFQWVNPKAWSMALTAITLYSPQHDTHTLLIIALVFALVNLPSVSSWVVLGQQMSRWLHSPQRLRVFNWTMALLLVASLAMML